MKFQECCAQCRVRGLSVVTVRLFPSLGICPLATFHAVYARCWNLPDWLQRLVCFFPVMSHSCCDWGTWARAGHVN